MKEKNFERILNLFEETIKLIDEIVDNIRNFEFIIIDELNLDHLLCQNCGSLHINTLFHIHCCPSCYDVSKYCLDWCDFRKTCKGYREIPDNERKKV